jgi:hypothetical protein
LYLAGIIAGDPSADAKGPDRADPQEDRRAPGRRRQPQVKLLSATIYVANMGIFGEMNSAWDAWIDPANTPARATDRGAAGRPKYLVEIMAIAAI